MYERDLFVALVSVILGMMMIHSAVLNQGWCLEMAAARIVREQRGKRSARFLIGSIGTFILMLGVYTFFAPYLANLVARDTASDGSNGATSIVYND